MDTSEKIRALPALPGVYIMKGPQGEVLYIGKARNLRKRVSSYFQKGRIHSGRLVKLISSVKDLEYIQTSTEAEALLYENNLIKQMKPVYNVALRDDKTYPLLKLTENERYPRLFVTRIRANDGSVYYGPYSDAKLLKEAVGALRQIFPLRSCGKLAKRPCLNYHIRQCSSPCSGRVSDADYGEVVGQLKMFLDGRKAELIKSLTQKMVEESRKENFETAAKIRSRIEALGAMKEKSISYYPSAELDELARLLKIEKPLDVIEAFDVSSIMGKEAVGSMVYFFKGRPRKSQFRLFRIKTVSQNPDDYAMMREIVRRRYVRLIAEKRRLPDMILIDGGKGHLSAAAGVLKELGLDGIPAIGLAKEFEHIYTKNAGEPMILPRDSKSLHLLERIRDEAHRFALRYHTRLRAKAVEFSELDSIRGIGKKRKKALLERFGSVEEIRRAGVDELRKADKIDDKTAKNIIDHFKR